MADTQYTPEEQALIDKARSTASTIPLGGTADAPPPSAVTPSRERLSGVQEWGPYDNYTIITAPNGQFGVPKGKILYFQEVEQFSRREGRMLKIKVPRYRLPDQPGTGRPTQAVAEAHAAGMVAGPARPMG